MNKSKLLLSCLREGDFAHPGGINAIELAMEDIAKNKNQYLLDVGSGLGGTANYLQLNGWGQVQGIDIDEDVISYAKATYPHCTFQHGNVTDCQQIFSEKKFDVIYFFSSFFCFPNQSQCLKNLAQIAKANCRLVIFDYSMLNALPITNPFPWSKTVKEFHPICLATIESLLTASGWELQKCKDISDQFQAWYQDLVEGFRQKQTILRSTFGEELVDHMYKGYLSLLYLLDSKELGGTIVYAKKR